ncbi:unnamed protein product [Echinostoma caproni]|uniref:Ubiquitin-like domain-containing protein n=1 Tax=Echinostoma caproni TaxID=27848 RepID=A0A183ALP0_9TREM|nr:unnamed protein product [Echinostoma caproni]
MKVPSVKLEVDGEPIFLKRRVLPYGQREGVLKALQNMEQDVLISKVESSAWATPIVVAMKSDVQEARQMVHRANMTSELVHVMRRSQTDSSAQTVKILDNDASINDVAYYYL